MKKSALPIFLFVGIIALASAKKEAAPPIDPTAYDALVSNRVTQVDHLLNWFAEQQDSFERLIPPGLEVLNQPGSPDVLVIDLDSKDLSPEFAKHLLGTTPVFRYSVPTYDVFVQETAEGTIEVRDSDGNVLYADPAPNGYAIPYEALFRQSQYPHHYIPELARYRLNARVTLLPLAYVEHYLFAKQQVEEAATLFEEQDPPMQMMMSGSGDDVWISAMTRMTNGLQLSLDYTESYSGQVWSAYSYDARYCPVTNSVGGSGGGSPPVPGTNDPPACTNCPISDCDIDVTNSFLGLERVWTLTYSNLLLTGATRTVWLDTRPMGVDAQTNPTHRFYGFGSNVDTDNDWLNDGHELFISHTDRENADTDGDGLPDGWEVQNGLDPNNAADASLLLPNTAVNYLTAYQLGLNLTGQYSVVTLGPSDVQVAYKARRAERSKFTGFPAFIQPTNGPPVYYLGIDGMDNALNEWTETEISSGGLNFGMGVAYSNEFSYTVVAGNMQYVSSDKFTEDLIQIDEADDWYAYEGDFDTIVWAYTSGVHVFGYWFGDISGAYVTTTELYTCWNIGNWTYWSNYYTTNFSEDVLNWPDPDPPLVNSRYASLTVGADRFELIKGFELHESRGTNAYYTEAFEWEAVWEMHTPYTTPMLETNAAGDLIGLAVSHPWSNQVWASQVVKYVGESACDSIFVWTNSLTTNASSRGLSLDEKTLDIEEVAYRFAKATQSNVIYRLQWLERFESTMTNGAGQVEEVHTVHFLGNGTTQYVGDATRDIASNQTAYATLATNNAAPDFLLEVPLAQRGNGQLSLQVAKVDIVQVSADSHVHCTNCVPFNLTADSWTNVAWTLSPNPGTNGAQFFSGPTWSGSGGSNIWHGTNAWLCPGVVSNRYTLTARSVEFTNFFDDATLDVQKPTFVGLNWLEATNEALHHTSLYQTNALVLRRSGRFSVEATLSRGYTATCFNVWFEAVHNFDGTPKTNRIPLVSNDLGESDWYCKLLWLSNHVDQTTTARLEISVPSTNCPIGEYQWRAMLAPKAATNVILSATNFPGPVIILFNPWSDKDSVYMASDADREEYVIRTTGKIWLRSGFTATKPEKMWRYAQFDSASLGVLLSELSPLTEAQRRSPSVVSRHLSARINSNGGGILEGRWDGNYSAGANPSTWTGSDQILERYRNTAVAVKYGQCWVFGGLLTTLLRTVGIPSRPLTNYDSFHDRDANKSWDLRYKQDASGVWQLFSDATHPFEGHRPWNFHVWCDAWMSRPDRSGGDGWQAVDATPQETSGGTFQCGPAPLAAVRADTGGDFDVDFVFAEVSAPKKVWHWIGGGWVLQQTIPNVVGFQVRTKAVGADTWQDITDDYK